MSIIGQKTSNNLVKSGHVSGVDSGKINPLYNEQYGNEVEHGLLKESIMRKYIKFRPVRGTDTLTNMRIGSTTLQKVTGGVRPTDSSPTYDNISIKVDTMVLARTNTALLDDFLSHIDNRKEVAIEHSKTIGKFFDESILIQGIKGAQITIQRPTKDAAGKPDGGTELNGGWEDAVRGNGDVEPNKPTNRVRTAPETFQGGTCVSLASVAARSDADALTKAIMRVCERMETKDIDIDDAVLFIRPTDYYTLIENDKLIDTRFSLGNGNYANAMVLKVNGIRIVKTNRLPSGDAVGVRHFLSNAGNGNAYDTTQLEADCIALILMPKALLAGETIPLTSKVHWSDVEIQWFIDSYLAYAVTPNRAEAAGAVFTVRT